VSFGREPAVTTDAKSQAPIDTRKKKKQSVAAMQRELAALSAPAPESDKSPVQLRKSFVRVGLVLAVVWALAIVFSRWSRIPLIVAGVLTVLGVGLAFWVVRYVNKSRELGALLRSAGQNEDGRKDALRRLETDFKKGDVQAVLARAQLEMQDDPRKALATLESVDLGKQLGPVADQVRCTRATIHLQLGELQEARTLVDKLELGKQQEPKTRAMFAAVAGEAWGRTGQGKKAVEILEVFNPEEPGYSEMRVQMWRARAFAYAGAGDMKGASRALRKLVEMNPQLLGMFVGARKVHPLLQQEAKQLLMRSGAVPKRMIRERI
jgi:tetratricopeptide (TPR) repeat protein